MAITYAQTSAAAGPFVTPKFCSSATLAAANSNSVICTDGGTLGSNVAGSTLNSSQTDTVFYGAGGGRALLELTVASGVIWSAGTWTVRLNVTTANMNLTLQKVAICRLNSANVNQEKIGEATGLAVGLGTTGVKSINVTGIATTPSVGDKVMILWSGDNSAMSTQAADITYNQNIDSPFSVPAAFIAEPPTMITRQSRNRAALH